MAILHKNITVSGDIHNPKWHPDANNGDYAWKNEKGELESIDELLLPAALNFVDGSVAPPTSNTNDIYILSSGGSVNVGWGSVALQDWVKYDGAAWNAITPQKSSLCYDKTADSLMSFDGTAWAAIGGGNTIYTANDTIGSGRVATITDSLTFAGGKLILSSVNDGILLNRLTDLEMASLIATAQDNEVIFNTDKHALYRFDTALNNWVALAAGFGIVGTTDSAGSPTFYATVKAAYDAGQGSVKLYSDITESVSRTINIVNGRDIDLNGFTYTYSATDGSNMFDDNSVGNTIRIINGRLLRTGGTTSSYVLNFNGAQTQIDVVNVYAENLAGPCLSIPTVQRFNGVGSTFVGNLGNAIYFNSGDSIKGGTYINNGSGNNTISANKISNIIAEVNSGRNFVGGFINNSQFYATTGKACNVTTASSIVSNCFVKSTTGEAVQGVNTAKAINCTLISDTGKAAYQMLSLINCYITSAASAHAVVTEVSLIEGCNIVSTSTGTGYGIYYSASTNPKVINNTIEIQGTSGQAISLQGATDASVFNNTINVANSAIIGIRMYAKNAYIFGNVAKGTTNLINATTGTNLWTASIDSANNSAEL